MKLNLFQEIKDYNSQVIDEHMQRQFCGLVKDLEHLRSKIKNETDEVKRAYLHGKYAMAFEFAVIYGSSTNRMVALDRHSDAVQIGLRYEGKEQC